MHVAAAAREHDIVIAFILWDWMRRTKESRRIESSVVLQKSERGGSSLWKKSIGFGGVTCCNVRAQAARWALLGILLRHARWRRSVLGAGYRHQKHDVSSPFLLKQKRTSGLLQYS